MPSPGMRDPEGLANEEGSPSTSAVRGALDRLLESQPFRTSKQCQDLLRYIVDRSLSGDDASLRERVIGTEVFGRKATYDTGEDPVVRVRAADVRKRLAQYYQSDVSRERTVRIELQPGSYLAHFRADIPSRKDPIPLSVVPIEREPPSEALTIPADPKVHRFRFPSVRALALSSDRGRNRRGFPGGCGIVYGRLPQERFWAPLKSLLSSLCSSVPWIERRVWLYPGLPQEIQRPTRVEHERPRVFPRSAA